MVSSSRIRLVLGLSVAMAMVLLCACAAAEAEVQAECGRQAADAVCLFGACCSKDGMCGRGDEYCGDGCQEGAGRCDKLVEGTANGASSGAPLDHSQLNLE